MGEKELGANRGAFTVPYLARGTQRDDDYLHVRDFFSSDARMTSSNGRLDVIFH